MSLADGGGADEPDWPWHERSAGDLAAQAPSLGLGSQLYPGDHLAEREAWITAVRARSPELAGSLLLLLIRRAAAEGGWSHDTASRVRGLRRIRVTVTAGDAAYALRSATALPDTWAAGEVLVCAAAMAGQAPAAGSGGVRHAAGHGAQDLVLAAAATAAAESAQQREYLAAQDRDRILRDLSGLIRAPGRSASADAWPIAAADNWSAAVLAGLRTWQGPVHQVNAVFGHLTSATGNRPTRQWLADAAAVLSAADAGAVVRLLIEAAVTADGLAAPEGHGPSAASLAVSARNARLLCAAAWAASAVDDDWVVPALSALATRGTAGIGGTGARGVAESRRVRARCVAGLGVTESGRVRASCITSLGLIASDAAILALEEISRSAADRAVRAQVKAALDVAARRRGREPGEFAERIVNAAYLDSSGERAIVSGGLTARVRITGAGDVVTEWQGRRGWSARRPAGAETAARHPVRLAAREVSDALAAERGRLEALLAQDRQWPAADWRRLYLGHPVTGPLTRALIWVFEAAGGEPVAGLPGADGQLATPAGERDLPARGTVALWHPARAPAAEVQAWRDMLTARGRAQPFPQAFRETYAPAESERGAATTSERFAGRILRYPQAYSMLSEFGWDAGYLGPFDGGLTGQARKAIAGTGLIAVLAHAAIGTAPGDLGVDRCLAGQVTFRRRGRRAPVRLASVPDVTFSEVIRDIDLVVTATAVP